MDNITDFLYLIGSVFAPMIAVQIADFYILQRDRADRAVDVRGLVLWAVGFAAYRGLMMVDLPLGSTIPDIALTVVLCVVVDKLAAKTSASEMPSSTWMIFLPCGGAAPQMTLLFIYLKHFLYAVV